MIAVGARGEESGGRLRGVLANRRDVARAVCACLLLLALPSASSADDAKTLTTILLVARPGLPDANFKDSIVLVMNNIASAPVGVIVNRPTRIAVSQLFPGVERLAKLQDKLYFGGPVALTSVSFLYRSDAPHEDAISVLDDVYFSANRELLEKLLGRERPTDGLRIFIGRSGWAPGQLEREIARGDWSLAPARSDAIFDRKSEHPWPERESTDAGKRI